MAKYEEEHKSKTEIHSKRNSNEEDPDSWKYSREENVD